MLSTESCRALLDVERIDYGNTFTLICRTNMLHIHLTNRTLKLNESQKRFMVCLFKQINCKREIINIVWYENHQKINDNNYHQLVYKTRALLLKAGLPDDVLMTLHYFGVKLNESVFNDHSTLTLPDSVTPESVYPASPSSRWSRWSRWLRRLLP